MDSSASQYLPILSAAIGATLGAAGAILGSVVANEYADRREDKKAVREQEADRKRLRREKGEQIINLALKEIEHAEDEIVRIRLLATALANNQPTPQAPPSTAYKFIGAAIAIQMIHMPELDPQMLRLRQTLLQLRGRLHEVMIDIQRDPEVWVANSEQHSQVTNDIFSAAYRDYLRLVVRVRDSII